MSDYTQHRDEERMRRYVARHGGSVTFSDSSLSSGGARKVKKTKKDVGAKSEQTQRRRGDGSHSTKEDWDNECTAGFWSRWLLWEKPSMKEAIEALRKRQRIRVRMS
jgi:hypothetical protein